MKTTTKDYQSLNEEVKSAENKDLFKLSTLALMITIILSLLYAGG